MNATVLDPSYWMFGVFLLAALYVSWYAWKASKDIEAGKWDLGRKHESARPTVEAGDAGPKEGEFQVETYRVSAPVWVINSDARQNETEQRPLPEDVKNTEPA